MPAVSSGNFLHKALRGLDTAARICGRKSALAPHLATGERGEEAAYFYLRNLGYVMVARRYRSSRRRGEIDLIGWDQEILSFIEVKTRTTRAVAPAEAAVDREKQRELAGMAREYLRRVKSSPATRFDVISVYFEAGKPEDITLFKNAFTLS
jgi:putative endonuclease